MGYNLIYPLVNIQKTMENHHFQWVIPLEIAIFNSYVKLPQNNTDITYTDITLNITIVLERFMIMGPTKFGQVQGKWDPSPQ